MTWQRVVLGVLCTCLVTAGSAPAGERLRVIMETDARGDPDGDELTYE